jgi:hypothetical protein
MNRGDAPGVILAQLLGVLAAALLFRWLVPELPKNASAVIPPHDEEDNR